MPNPAEETIRRIQENPNASLFVADYSSENAAKAALLKLSFARAVQQGCVNAVAMPGHIVTKMYGTLEKTIMVIMGGPMTDEEACEAWIVFSKSGANPTVAFPKGSESRLLSAARALAKNEPSQKPKQPATPLHSTTTESHPCKLTPEEIREGQEYDRQRAEILLRQQPIIDERRRRGLCINCGIKIGIISRFLNKKAHARCTTFRE